MTQKFLAACVQLNSSDDVKANISAVCTHVVDAASSGAKLVLLPENTFYINRFFTGDENRNFTTDNHAGILKLRELAAQYSLHILIGSVSVLVDGASKPYNRSVLIDDSGEIAATYDKIHLFDVTLSTGEKYFESSNMAAGNKIVVAETPWGKLGLSICYDIRFPYMYRQMAQSGALYMAIPAAFTETTGKAHWHVLCRARAIENGCYVFAPAQTGVHAGNRRTYGHSLIIDPWGEVLAEKETDTGFIIAEIDPQMVAATRTSIPSVCYNPPELDLELA